MQQRKWKAAQSQIVVTESVGTEPRNGGTGEAAKLLNSDGSNKLCGTFVPILAGTVLYHIGLAGPTSEPQAR